ncbi:MAG: hypothetical protein HY293_09685 [Planctomycetes bacterium]|nr:hypothetical protein [Planctomycetota bacterium]
MPMSCPSCGRPLASGAKCVYCGQGTQFKRKEQLQIPKGALPQKRKSSFPWGKLLLLLLVAGAVAACFLHPELNAKIKSLIP